MRWRRLWAGGNEALRRRFPHGKREMGMSLGGTLMAVAVLSLLAFTLASLSVTHLRLSNRQELGLCAANAARSAVSTAISKLLQDKNFGKSREEVRVEQPESLGLVSFDERVEGFSSNNLEGTENAPGAGGVPVPAATARLIAVGRCGGVERRVEATLRLPPFPWAIASSGNIVTRNGVLVASLPQGVWPPPTDPNLLEPADLVANGSGAEAIVLREDSTVLGDIEAVGQVSLDPEHVVVKGEVRPGSKPAKLPVLRPEDHNPGPDTVHTDLKETRPAEISGTVKAVGDKIDFPNPLRLSGGVLYVEGNLHLKRGLTGTGMVVATGDITIDQGADLEGLTDLAVISGGHVSLTGGGPASSAIRGLFYAEKGLYAKELTLVGSLLTGSATTGAASADGDGGVDLDTVNVFYEPPHQVTTTTSSGGISNGGLDVGVLMVVGETRPVLTPKVNDSDPGGVFGSIMYIDFAPKDGGYPVDVTVSGTLASMPTRTLNSPADLQTFLDDLTVLVKNSSNLPSSGGAQVGGIGGGAFAGPADAIKIMNGVRDSMSEMFGASTASSSTTPPVVTIFADISRFLPWEDRVRVVSWIEN